MKLPTIIEGEFEDQGQIDQDSEEWLSPRGAQPNLGFLYKEDKQESTWIKGSDPEGAIIINRASAGSVYTMVFVNGQRRWKGLETNYKLPCAADYKMKRAGL